MPTLAQMEAATPKCPHVRSRNVPGAGVVRERCGRPCRYIDKRNVWQCPLHGDVLDGALLGQINNDAAVHLEVPG